MREPLRLLTIVPLVWSILSTFSLAQVKGNAQLPTHQQLSRLGLERAWWAHAVINPSRDKVQHVSIDEDVIYVQASSGVVTALDAETGHQLWAVQLGRFDQPSFPAISNETEVLIVVGSTMHGLDKYTGRTLWNLTISGQATAAPAVDENQVYFGTLDGSVYAYNLKKIHRLFEQRRLPEWSGEAEVWMYKAAKEITSPPIVDGHVVNFASRDGSLYSVTALDRKLKYQMEMDKPIVAPLARLDNTMFVASEDNSFLAINLLNGQVIWEFTSGLPIRKPIWAINHDLFLLPDRGGMFCLDPATGNRKWSNSKLNRFVASLAGTIATMDVDGNLVLVNGEKGEILGTLPMRRFTVRTGNERTDRIYLATERGLILCLRQIGHSFPVFHRYPDRLPLLPELEPEDAEKTPSKTDSPDA